ncbi:ACT domain-containing protein ACR2 isoform X2 [Magnolia sinica]|uniref:ACT domain-containing protein ACR2 isoform X2 n=1 Tax=Magnolia sinica TaxID=86752 RepID=UPI002659348C|nr:ACT domain-containing protein ACR2 isoform X2 [Magnolia sinica]XP_058112075.1 ACT domain-containing protein ACR2 isoform X2 [Magnolia sinica]
MYSGEVYVQVDCDNKHGLLLDVVQVLTDMDLVICKSYVCSDAGWFMDVFHVRDESGNKIRDERLINYIKQAISPKELRNTTEVRSCSGKIASSETSSEHTAIEMTGTDRPGLFSEISAVLTDLRCNVVEAHAWSHNARLACIVHVSDESTAGPIDDPSRLATIKDHLSTVLRADTAPDDQIGRVKTAYPGDDSTVSHQERRLHQLMLAGQDFHGPVQSVTPVSPERAACDDEGRKTIVSIDRCNEKGYSVVHIECKDRPKLIFDTVCALTDLQFVVFHASTIRHDSFTTQEYYIRHVNGCTLETETEMQLVAKCLEAAIERRVCEGVRLELCAHDRVGLLSDVTRLLREYGLTVARADIETQGEEVINVFYVRDISGNAVDMEIVDSMKREMEPLALQVKSESLLRRSNSPERPRFSFGNMLRSQIERFSQNFI